MTNRMHMALAFVYLSSAMLLSCASGGTISRALKNTGAIRGNVAQGATLHGWQARIELRTTVSGIDIDSLRRVGGNRYAELRKAYLKYFPDYEFIMFAEIDQDGAFDVRSLPEGEYSVVLRSRENARIGLCGEDSYIPQEVVHVKVVRNKAAVVLLSGYCDRDPGRRLGPAEWQKRYENLQPRD